MSMKGKETMSKQDEKIVMGKFGATYGIRGWLKVFPTQTTLKAYLITLLGTLTKRGSGLNSK